jgi:hypothetical protein
MSKQYPPFCFSAARRKKAEASCTQDRRRAAEKQKGLVERDGRSIDRSPLTGFAAALRKISLI